MKVHVVTGDILTSKSQTLVNTVNCVGIMGKGIALKFKQRFPDMYADYRRRCDRGEVKLGEPYLWKGPTEPWVINFPTKQHWRSVARLEDIIEGLNFLQHHVTDWGVKSLAVPPLGSGEGRLEWRIVGPTLYKHLRLLNIPVELYSPWDAPIEQLTPEFLEGTSPSVSTYQRRLEPSVVALAEIVWRVERAPYHWKIGHTSFQKIGYFAQALGLPTRIEFTKASYGPYSDDLKRILVQLVNNGLLREEQIGSMFQIHPGRAHETARAEYMEELLPLEPVIRAVTDLALRFSGTELEIAATAHYVAQRLAEQDGKPTEVEVMEAVQSWKERRRPSLSDTEIALTIRTLNLLGIIDLELSDSIPVPDMAVAE